MEDTSSSSSFNSPVPLPVFSSSPVLYVGRITCQICFESSLIKHEKREHFQRVDKTKFLKYSLEWKHVDHCYNLVHSKVDCSSKEIWAHKNCKGIFFKGSFLSSQTLISTHVSQDALLPQDIPIESEESEGTSTAEMRKSSRQKLVYASSRLEEKLLKCIICNSDKMEKGRPIPLTLLTFADKTAKCHKAEKSLVEFSKIHLEKDTMIKDASQRILLV